MNVIFVGLYFFAVVIFLSLVFRFWGYISYKLFVFCEKIVNYIKSKIQGIVISLSKNH